MSHQANRTSRRRFIKQAGAGAAALPFVTGPFIRAAENKKLRHVTFGAAGQAGGDVRSFASHPQFELVAACDVDENNLNKLKANFPNIKTYVDWRELLDKEKNNFDSCNVSVPDHMHGPIGVSAMRLGKHLYCQKPLGQNLHDTRMLKTEAKKNGVITQMGVQIHSSFAYRWPELIIKGGHIGKLVEVHTWSSKKWGDKGPRPTVADPIPAGFHWDLWLGVSEERPFKKGYYHPGNWRRRLDFGTGTFGDMGCHIYDPVFKATGSPIPQKVTSRGPAPDGENWAINAVVEYEFKGNEWSEKDTLPITWYDGDAKPPQRIVDLLEGRRRPSQGSIFVGTEGTMLLPHIGNPMLFPEAKFKGQRNELFPKLEPWNHYHKFIDGCLSGEQPSCNFEYAGPLTEAVILGCAAAFFPDKQLHWDAEKLRFTNHDAANDHVRRTYRMGWEVAGMG